MIQNSLTIQLSFVAVLGLQATWANAADTMARLHDKVGQNVGQVLLTKTPHGTLLHLNLRNMPAGAHAFHVHQSDSCIPPFTSAGVHFNPTGAGHGIMDDNGLPAGEMPNLHVPENGELEQEVLNTNLDLSAELLDEDERSHCHPSSP